MEWALLPLKRFADFNGRSRRKEYWSFWLLSMGAMIAAITLDNMLGLGGTSSTSSDLSGTGVSASVNATGGMLSLMLMAAMIVPSIAVAVRRMHDMDKSGWILLLALVPFVNFYLLYLAVQPGIAGPNRFGPDPKIGEGLMTA